MEMMNPWDMDTLTLPMRSSEHSGALKGIQVSRGYLAASGRNNRLSVMMLSALTAS